MSLVLYSGGCDSTIVLHDLLKERIQNYSASNITALAINHAQVPANTQNKAARLSFIEEMKSRELDKCFHYQEVNIDGSANVGGIGEYGLSQPIVWSTLAMLYIQNNETIYFGYHAGDDFWLHKNAFEDAIMNICKVCNKTIKIEYPLRQDNKSDIIKKLKSRGLYDMCWYCEYPVSSQSSSKGYEPCGNCVPCRTHRTALWQIETFGNTLPTTNGGYCYFDTNVKSKAINDVIVTPSVDYTTKEVKGI